MAEDRIISVKYMKILAEHQWSTRELKLKDVKLYNSLSHIQERADSFKMGLEFHILLEYFAFHKVNKDCRDLFPLLCYQ